MVQPQLATQPVVQKKSKTPLVLGIVAIVAVVLCGGGAACAALISKAASESPSTGGPAGGNAVGLNEPVRDGKFEFTVTAVQCGIPSVGTDPLIKTALGQYCKVSMTVKNIGDEPQMFTASNQYAYNAARQKYEADTAAGIYLQEESRAFLQNINPGNSVDGVILFDIPADAQLASVELHDSLFSGGVTVTL